MGLVRPSRYNQLRKQAIRPCGAGAPARDSAKSTRTKMTTLREQIATNVLTVTKFRELLHQMRENRPNDDLELIRKAYEFSQKNHSGQQRASGEPYLVHPWKSPLCSLK